MPEVIECPECRRKLNLPEGLLGEQVQCPSCGTTFTGAAAYRLAPKPPARPVPAPRVDENRRRPRERDDDPRRRDWDDDLEREGKNPDRGAAVLTLGILALVFSCLFIPGLVLGIIALAMGTSDLNEMTRGRMSRAGEGSTQAGKVCGLIAIVLSVMSLFFWCMAYAKDF